MKVIVDADSLPREIKNILVKAAHRLEFKLIFVANATIKLPASKVISMKVVSHGIDKADDYIADISEKNDVIITSDIPLADRVISKGAFAIDSRGGVMTEVNIKSRLAARDLLEQLRDEGMSTGGPPRFCAKDIQEFANQFDKMIIKLIKQINK